MKPLKSFFLEEFRELYRREKQWLIILPEVARHMPPSAVRNAVAEHLERTAARVNRLEEIFRLLAETDQQASRSVKPLLFEADQVLAAVTLSSFAARQEADRAQALDARTPGWGRRDFFAPSSQN
jgi:ferritin-like metal-binding protein YciE